MKVAVVGGGFGGRVVAPVFAGTEGCEVVDVVSARDDDAVRALVARPEVDLVSVHSPPFLHAAHVRAAMLIGMQAVYLDAGSGASRTVSPALVAAARGATRGTLFVGGGVRNAAAVHAARAAGADYVVVGTVIERDGTRAVRELADAAAAAPARVGA